VTCEKCNAKPQAVTLDDAGSEALGRLVRRVWVEFAKTQPNPKPHHLLPWEDLDEPNKEVDRLIGRAVATAAIESAFEAVMRQPVSAPDERRAMVAEARRSLRIAPAVEAPPGYRTHHVECRGPAVLAVEDEPLDNECDNCGADMNSIATTADICWDCWRAHEADVRSAVEADRKAVREWFRDHGYASVWQDYRDACRAVDAKTPPASVYRTPPVAVAPSVVEECARIVQRAFRWPVDSWQDSTPAATALLAHLAAKLESAEAQRTLDDWLVSCADGAPGWSQYEDGLRRLARVVLGEVKAGEAKPGRVEYLAERNQRLEDELVSTRAELRAAREDLQAELTKSKGREHRIAEADRIVEAVTRERDAAEQLAKEARESAEHFRLARDEARAERDAATKRLGSSDETIVQTLAWLVREVAAMRKGER
jgi:hypothetical protein